MTFDPAAENWVSVNGRQFFFEPLGGNFDPGHKGSVVVSFGSGSDRHRGIEVDVLDDGCIAIWTPVGSRVYWLPKTRVEESNVPWESRLREVDYQSGTFK